jgi:hypothetical protein
MPLEMSLSVVAVAAADGLRLDAPPASDLLVLSVPSLPPLPELAIFTARMNRPVIVGTSGPETRAVVLDRWGRVPVAAPSSARDDRLVVHRLGGRLVGLMSGSDRHVPEKARAMALMGVDLVLGFGRDPKPYGPLWAYTQQNQFLALEVSGEPALYLACEMSTDGSGAQPLEIRGGWAVVELPWERRTRLLEAGSVLRDLNPEAYLIQPWWDG